MKTSRFIPVLALVGTIVLVQLLTLAGGKAFFLTQLTMSAYYSLIVIGLCLLMGFAGQISLGHAGFFAIGGYTSAVLTTLNLSAYKDNLLVAALAKLGLLTARQDLYGSSLLSVHPWAACVVAVLLAFAVAWAIGIPVLKLKGHYLAMATLGFGTIIYSIVLGTQRFGAADGISSVPPFPLLPGMSVSGDPSLRVLNYYFAWLLVDRCHGAAVEPHQLAGGPGAPLDPRRRRRGGRHGRGHGPIQVLHLHAERRAGRGGRRVPHAFQRRHRPFRGVDHEVRALRGDRCCRRHGEPLGHAHHERGAELPLAARVFRDSSTTPCSAAS